MNGMMQTSRNGVMGGLIVLALAVQGWAVDRFVMNLPRAAMIGDTNIVFTVTPFEKQKPALGSHRVIFDNLPVGVRVESDPASQPLTVSGETLFKLILGPETHPGFVFLKIRSESSQKVQGQVGLIIQPTVSRFSISPVGSIYEGKMGAPLSLQIKALDETGSVVTAFRDPVKLWATKGSLNVSEIMGGDFADGVTQVTVRFNAVDPVTRGNSLFIQAGMRYSGQRELASGTYRVAMSSRPGEK